MKNGKRARSARLPLKNRYFLFYLGQYPETIVKLFGFHFRISVPPVGKCGKPAESSKSKKTFGFITFSFLRQVRKVLTPVFPCAKRRCVLTPVFPCAKRRCVFTAVLLYFVRFWRITKPSLFSLVFSWIFTCS